MARLILFISLVLLITLQTQSDEFVEVPDYFKPIEGNAIVDFVYEFDESPIEILHKQGDEYIIITKDDEDYQLYLYDDIRRTFEKKMDFELEGHYLSHTTIEDTELVIYTRHQAASMFRSNDHTGYYFQRNTIDLSDYSDVDYKIEFSNLKETFFKMDERRFYSGFDTNKVEFGALGRQDSSYKFYGVEFEWIVLKIIDESRIYSSVVHNSEEDKLYYHRADYKNDKLTNVIEYVLIDSVSVSSYHKLAGPSNIVIYQNIDSNLNTTINYSYFDKEENALSLNLARIDSKGNVELSTQNSEKRTFLDGANYLYGFEITKSNQVFSHILNSNRELEAILYTQKNEYKQRKLSPAEKKLFTQKDDKFGSNLNDIYNYKDNYIVFSEKSNFTSSLYEYAFGYILIYSIKQDMSKINWVKFIPDRYLESLNSFQKNFSIDFLITPEYYENELKFIYSQGGTKPTITKTTLNMDNGEIVEVDLFENDYTISYLPPFQYHIKDNVYFGLLSIENDYFVRYRILK